jgi:hypothetical protein
VQQAVFLALYSFPIPSSYVTIVLPFRPLDAHVFGPLNYWIAISNPIRATDVRPRFPVFFCGVMCFVLGC